MTSSPDPFHSPKTRLKWANEDIDSLYKHVKRFLKTAPYRQVIDLDADGITQILKLKFTERLPEGCTQSATKALENLRHTLDQIGYAAAVASGKVAPKQTYFPIGDSLVCLENIINRNRCR